MLDVNLFNLPEVLGARLGVDAFAGGLICSVIFLMMTLFPVALINRSRRGSASDVVEAATGVSVLGVCVGMGWFPVWILIMICLTIACLFMPQIKGKTTG